MRMRVLPGIIAAALVVLQPVTSARADQVTQDQADPAREGRPPSLVIPFAFSTEALETGAGAVYFRNNVFSPVDSLFLTGYATSNSSYGLFGGLNNVQLSERLFLSTRLGFMDNDQQRFYGDFGYEIGGLPPSGGNDSDPDDFVFGTGIDTYLRMDFRYVLPIGAGSQPQPHTYTMNSGLLVDGSTNLGTWNPLESGRTIVVLRPFYQRRTLEVTDENVGLFPPAFPVEPGDEPDVTTSGLMLGIEYDNTDFVTNPTRGSMTKLNVYRDFGAFDSFNTWTSLDLSFSKYWSLGESGKFAQRVIALNAWTAYTPTWETEQVSPDFVAIRHRPPNNYGTHLGGVERQRGYPRGRFSDKAAVNYAAEIRLIPHWDPFKNWPVIRNWPWRWWQAVGFAELGRVAPTWDIGTLHEDMKWTAGVGFRVMIGGGIVRLDWAVSDETSVIWVMAKHAF